MSAEIVSQILTGNIDTIKTLFPLASLISEIADTMVKTLTSGGAIYTFGNGGSAADAQHIATELSGRFLKDRSGLHVISLSTNACLITAVGNDYGFEYIFARQLEGVIRENDLVIGISTSGRSKNVLKALAMAKEKGAKSVGLTGRDGGDMPGVTDLCLIVPSNITPRIQEAHTLIVHILCDIVEQGCFKSN